VADQYVSVPMTFPLSLVSRSLTRSLKVEYLINGQSYYSYYSIIVTIILFSMLLGP